MATARGYRTYVRSDDYCMIIFQTVDMTGQTLSGLVVLPDLRRNVKANENIYKLYLRHFFAVPRLLPTLYKKTRINVVYAPVFPSLTHRHWCSPAFFKFT